MRKITMQEVEGHNTPDDCWVVINGKVYDLSVFQQEHPGGSPIITNNAGKDVSNLFNNVHPKDIPERLLSPEACVGVVDMDTVDPARHVVAGKEKAPPRGQKPPSAPSGSGVPQDQPWEKPPIDAMLNTFDFESVAARTMTEEGWGYYSSGGDDEITLRENHTAFQRIWFKPRILVNVKEIDMTTSILGVKSSLPLYFSATALGKLANESGELAISRAAASSDTIYMLPTLSSFPLDEMLKVRQPGQVQFGQLYVNTKRERTEEYVRQLEEGGVKAIFVTVDAPQLGRREKDMRNKFTKSTDVQKGDEVKRSEGVARAISEFIDPSLCWDDITWLKGITSMPIILKGVGCGLDTVMAYQMGCAGVVLSNHGGRQLDTARSAIEILPEAIAALDENDSNWRSNFEVFIDGGIRRGSDIFKALALGATAVGIGRPVLYSLAAYGQEGVERMCSLFKDELTMVMRLMGTPTIADISKSHVLFSNLMTHVPAQARDHLQLDTYEPLKPGARI
ncbi:FMN-dependent alpha-hydroxy acid dehydrogenase [Desulfospira joergensenii]|uniref:FMN-dependent alpha-hydroxy acid dehydrogenase n=1 Tax=Desulfospira joergensenii TaxID=53329 RepID=UPI0003B6A0F0|nr:FMN-dependent alpha-hydroxy acid dehydrogenase family protein [Desulfospira joergensenii]